MCLFCKGTCVFLLIRNTIKAVKCVQRSMRDIGLHCTAPEVAYVMLESPLMLRADNNTGDHFIKCNGKTVSCVFNLWSY